MFQHKTPVHFLVSELSQRPTSSLMSQCEPWLQTGVISRHMTLSSTSQLEAVPHAVCVYQVQSWSSHIQPLGIPPLESFSQCEPSVNPSAAFPRFLNRGLNHSSSVKWAVLQCGRGFDRTIVCNVIPSPPTLPLWWLWQHRGENTGPDRLSLPCNRDMNTVLGSCWKATQWLLSF